MNVLVNGLGNIGKTVLSVLLKYKELLEIKNIYALKNTSINEWNLVDLEILQDQGVIICTKQADQFEDLDAVIYQVDYIFDCNSDSIGSANKSWYESLPNLKGASAQGSEKDFGLSYMSGVNDIQMKSSKYAHIVSCNTHAIGALVKTLTGGDINKLIEGDFVVVRRSEDIGNHQRLVTANVVSRHMTPVSGTHHAIDAKDLFLTQGIDLNIQSSDITTPSQLMHTVRFNLKLTNCDEDVLLNQIAVNPLVAATSKYDSNLVFELGRRYGLDGRLYSHAIINSNNLLFDTSENRVKGWAFIPQEGNTILSTINAFVLQVGLSNPENKMKLIFNELLRSNW